MDVDAVLARHPRVALVDELAHTNVPGSRNSKRWQDIEELLGAGIDVITTVNIQHLESVNDVVEKITGVPQRETVPDSVVRAADQIELEDMTAEALDGDWRTATSMPPRRSTPRCPTTSEPATSTRCENWRCCGLQTGSTTRSSSTGRSTRSPAPGRRANAWSSRSPADRRARRWCVGLPASQRDPAAATCSPSTSPVPTGCPAPTRAHLRSNDSWWNRSAGTYHQVLGDDIPRALLAFARAENATQLVLGDSRRSGWARRLEPRHGGAHRAANRATSTSTSSPTPTPAAVWRSPRAAAASPRDARGRDTCSPCCCHRC